MPDFQNCKRCHALPAIAAGLLLACAQGAWAGEPAGQDRDWSPVWVSVQGGITALYGNSAQVQSFDKVDPYWKWELGMHVDRDWLLGIGRQKVILQNLDCAGGAEALGCSDLTEHFSQLYATVLFNPDHGHWLLQAGLGVAKYKYGYAGGSAYDEKHGGWGANFSAGYDWSPALHLHYGIRATLDYSHLGQHSSGLGSLSHSRLGLAFCLGWY